MEPGGRYFVITNDTPYGHEVSKRAPGNVVLVPAGTSGVLDTFDLLSLPQVQEFIRAHDADVLVFQNTSRIERLATTMGWNLINPSAELAKTVEEKISQTKWLGDEARKLLPPFKILAVKNVPFTGKKFVLQFNHAHTGQGTFIITSDAQLADLRDKFPDRECRVSDFIDGPVFTANVVVGNNKKILVGNPSYQITGLQPFTDLPFSTVGNDWALPQQTQFAQLRADISAIAEKIGFLMAKDGWKGLFGIDVIFNEAVGRTYLLEINARQPASTTFESEQQMVADSQTSLAPTIFEAHVAALLGMKINPFVSISGAQIVKRVTNTAATVDAAALRTAGFTVIAYENAQHNKESFRIQSSTGIMNSHNVLNERGQSISSCIR